MQRPVGKLPPSFFLPAPLDLSVLGVPSSLRRSTGSPFKSSIVSLPSSPCSPLPSTLLSLPSSNRSFGGRHLEVSSVLRRTTVLPLSPILPPSFDRRHYAYGVCFSLLLLSFLLLIFCLLRPTSLQSLAPALLVGTISRRISPCSIPNSQVTTLQPRPDNSAPSRPSSSW